MKKEELKNNYLSRKFQCNNFNAIQQGLEQLKPTSHMGLDKVSVTF